MIGRDRQASLVAALSASTVAAFSLAMMSFGVPFGAKKPNQPDI